MHIVFCTDSNYVMPTGVAITSICENNQNEDINFHIILIGISQPVESLDNIVQQYGQSVSFYFLSEEKLSAFPCKGSPYISNTAFARIFIPELLSEDIEKVIYLDCDVIVNANMADLWNETLAEDTPLAAAIDMFSLSGQVRESSGLPMNYTYFNSGVLLMNLNYWRANQCTQHLGDLANRNSYLYVDQDVLNVFFAGKIKTLSSRFNMIVTALAIGELNWMIPASKMEHIRQAIAQPVIIHYTSSHKPWTDDICPLRNIWEQYCELTVWKGNRRMLHASELSSNLVYLHLQKAYASNKSLFRIYSHIFAFTFMQIIKLRHKEIILRLTFLPIYVSGKAMQWLYKFKSWHRHIAH